MLLKLVSWESSSLFRASFYIFIVNDNHGLLRFVTIVASHLLVLVFCWLELKYEKVIPFTNV